MDTSSIWELGEMQTTQIYQITYSESWTICILTFWRVILMLVQPENKWQNCVPAVNVGRGSIASLWGILRPWSHGLFSFILPIY